MLVRAAVTARRSANISSGPWADDPKATADLAGERYWNQGLMTEPHAVNDFAFRLRASTLASLQRCSNEASRRVKQKTGAESWRFSSRSPFTINTREFGAGLFDAADASLLTALQTCKTSRQDAESEIVHRRDGLRHQALIFQYRFASQNPRLPFGSSPTGAENIADRLPSPPRTPASSCRSPARPTLSSLSR